MADEFHKRINDLNKAHEREPSLLGRILPTIMFNLGFSKCIDCIYCNSDIHKNRGMGESVVLTSGKCYWSENNSSSTLNYKDLRKCHRCPGFIPVFFDLENYCIDTREEELNYKRRVSVFIKWMGFMIALLIALLFSLLN